MAVGISAATKSLVVDILQAIPGYPHERAEGLTVIDDRTIAPYLALRGDPRSPPPAPLLATDVLLDAVIVAGPDVPFYVDAIASDHRIVLVTWRDLQKLVTPP